MQTMTIPRRFRGPPNSGNGGYVCGMLARRIAGAAEVTLRAPPPLETELDLVEVGTGVWELRQGTATIAIGQAVTLDLSRLERATYAEAVEAEKRTPIKPHEHLLPMCFVCGPDRAPGATACGFSPDHWSDNMPAVHLLYPGRPTPLSRPPMVWLRLRSYGPRWIVRPATYLSTNPKPGTSTFCRSCSAPFRAHRWATASRRAMR